MFWRVLKTNKEQFIWICVLVIGFQSSSAVAANFNANLQVPATNSTGSYTATWNASGSQTLQESVNGGSYSNVYIGTGTSKSFSGKAAGSYTYRVYRRHCQYVCIDLFSETKTVVVNLTPGTPGAISFSSLSHASNSGDNNGAFAVSWGAASGPITAYRLERRVNAGGWSQVHSSASRSSAQSGLASATYQYRVRACNGSNCSGFGATKTVYVAKTPGVPPSISVSPNPSTNGSQTISWAVSSGSISKYDLNRQINGASYTNLYDGTARSRSYSGLANGTYRYAVRACKTTASFTSCSGWRYSSTTSVTLPPSSPGAISFGGLSHISSSGDNNGAFTVSWGEASGTVTAYRLEQRQNSGAWTVVHNAGGTSKTRTGLANATFQYRVRACNGTACSSYSAVKTVYVALSPGVPSSISVSPALSTNGNHTVSWGTSSGSITQYQLFRKFGSGGYIQTYSGTSKSRAYSGLGNGNYTYRVRSCSTTASFTSCSGYRTGSVASISDPVAPGPISVSGLSSAGGDGDNNGAFTVNWGAATGTITAYQLEQRQNSGGWSLIHSASDTSKSRSGLSSSTYEYRVRACNGSSCSGYTAIKTIHVAITPGGPSSINSPSTDSDGSFAVSWGTSSGEVDTYELERQTNGGSWGNIYTGSSLSRAMNELPEGEYRFRVRACNSQATYAACSGYQTSATTAVLFDDADGDGVSDKIDAFPTDSTRTLAEFNSTSDGSSFSFSMMLKLDCDCANGTTIEYKLGSGLWQTYNKPLVFDLTTTVAARIHSQGANGLVQTKTYTRTLIVN